MSRPRAAARVLSLPAKPGSAEPVVRSSGSELRIGQVVGLEGASLRVNVPGHGVALARVAVPLTQARADAAVHASAEVVLGFEAGEPGRPIVLGFVEQEFTRGPAEAQVDGQRVVIEGKEEVVLRCGEATITLRANGKVLIRGAYVETRSSGTNRIKGGSVQIN
jgi:hypothetical protein